MSTQKRNFLIRWVLLIISLVLILFTGREKDAEGQTTLGFAAEGWESFRLGMDVAWGTRLTYKVDYSKYREQFTDQFAFNQAKQDAETIILQQIDGRISKLGVSDYNARPVTLNNEHYIQIELWWVQDIEEAKAIIGKTVELEFKLANTIEPSDEEYQNRKERAQALLDSALANPSSFDSIATNRQSDDITFTQWPSSTLAQLPSFYAEMDLDAMEKWEIYPTLVEWVYQDFPTELEAQGYQDLLWFTLVKLIDVTTQDTETVSSQQLVEYASTNSLDIQNTIVDQEPTIAANEFGYNENNKLVEYNAGEILIGQAGYDVKLYQSTWSIDDLLNQAKAEDGGAAIQYEWRINEEQVKQFVPDFVYEEDKQFYETIVTWGALLLEVVESKAVEDRRYALFTMADITTEQFAQMESDLKNQKLYTIEEIFVKDRSSRLTAIDPKTSEALDAKHFEIARVSADQLWAQVTSITFNEAGKRIFCNITEANIQEQLAIFVWGTLVSAPVIQDKICWWETMINGDFTGQTCYNKDGSTYPAATHREGTQCMVENLNEWALPAPLILTQEEKVSPTLWGKSLRGVIRAWVIWFVAIFLYMMFLYGVRRASVSLIVLVSFMIFLLALLKLMWYVISMSSLAALILTIGMSVDATILMFERVNEEAKNQPMESAIIDGCKRSRPAIRDGNLSTGLIALLLFMMWVNVFKWFWSMMIITIIIILVMIVPVTKMLLLWLERRD